jgi:uncharacterized protein
VRSVFADSHYYIAFSNPRDRAHAKASKILLSLRIQKVVTTAWVLTELADACAEPVNRRRCGEFIDGLYDRRDVEIVPPTDALFRRGLQLYNNRPDKEWSLTDCISFVVMKERRIKEALTGDHHFEQAGFVALLK